MSRFYIQNYLLLLLLWFAFVLGQYTYSYNDPYMQISGPDGIISMQYHRTYFGPEFINNTANYEFRGQLTIPNGPIDGCSKYPNTTLTGDSWKGKIVMVYHVKSCLSGAKVKLADFVGASAVLLMNCSPGAPSFCAEGRKNQWANKGAYATAGYTSIGIPSATILYGDGWPIFSKLQANPSLVYNVTLIGTGPLIDPTGSIKQAIVAMAKAITTPTLDTMLGNKPTQDWALNPTDPCTDINRPYAFTCVKGKFVGFDNGGRNLQGTVPAMVNELVDLNRLVLYQSSVKGIIPTMNNLTQLTDFILYQSPITSIFSSASLFQQLVVFDVGGARLSSIPSDMYLLQKLQIFVVSNNFLVQLPPISSSDLVMYDVSFNNIAGPLNNFSGMAKLVSVNIANNSFYATNCETLFDRLPYITYINLANNKLSGGLPRFLDCPRLRTVNCNFNMFTGGIPLSWNMPKRCSNNITMLCSNDCNCGQEGAVCKSLTSISISNNMLTGPFYLVDTSLIDIDLSNNLLDVSDPIWGSLQQTYFANIFLYVPQTIENINFAFNKLKGAWTSATYSTNLYSLQKLLLANNQITNLPTDMWGPDITPTVFRIIDVSYNNLSGNIPQFLLKTNVEQVLLQGNPLLTSGVAGSYPSWVEQRPPYIKYGSEPYICPTLVGNQGVPFVMRTDASFYNYAGCICDRGFYGSPPNCLDIPEVVTINGNKSNSNSFTFTDETYGSNRLTLGVDISWYLNYKENPNQIVKAYYIRLTRTEKFRLFNSNILEVYSGDFSLQGDRVLSVRGNDSITLNNIPELSQYPNMDTAAVFYPSATVVFRSRQMSGFHFYANYTVSFECPDKFMFHADTNRCQLVFNINQSIQIAIFAITSLFMILLLFITSVIITKRNSLIIRSSSFPFCLSMLVFMILLGVGSYFYAIYPDKGDFVCHIRPWLTAGPLVGILSALLVKVDRIRRIFTSKDLVVQTITNVQLAQTMGIMLGAELALLIGFSASGMSQSIKKLGYGSTNGMLVSVCTSTDSSLGGNAFNAWLIIQFIYIAAFLLVAVLIAWSVRKVPSAFNEAPSIASSLLSLAVLLIILIPLNYMVDDNPNALMLIRGLGQILVTSVLALFFFGPKLYLILEGKDNDKTLSSLGSSKSSTSSSVTSDVKTSSIDQHVVSLLKSIHSTFEMYSQGSTDISDLSTAKTSFEKNCCASSHCSQITAIVNQIESIISKKL